jgi:hypothetical protein
MTREGAADLIVLVQLAELLPMLSSFVTHELEVVFPGSCISVVLDCTSSAKAAICIIKHDAKERAIYFVITNLLRLVFSPDDRNSNWFPLFAIWKLLQITQELIDAYFFAGFMVHSFHDYGAVEAVGVIFSRQTTRDNNRARRNASVGYLAGFTI